MDRVFGQHVRKYVIGGSWCDIVVGVFGFSRVSPSGERSIGISHWDVVPGVIGVLGVFRIVRRGGFVGTLAEGEM